MSKKKRSYNNKAQVQPQKNVNSTNKHIYVGDAYSNIAARLGAFSDNLTEQSYYFMNRITKNYSLIDTMYRSSWIVGKIIDVIAEDMMKNWIDVRTGEKNEDSLKRFDKYVDGIKLREQLLEGLKWGRLYGGAAGIMLIRGQENILDEPLDYDMIMPDDFRGLLILNRWQGISPSLELVTDITDPEFGKPEYYLITAPELETTRVHHSRVVRFTGKELPFIERQIENYWGMSEVERVFDEINKRDTASANISSLIFMANLRILKIDNLAERLALGNEEDNEAVRKVLEAQNELMSSQALQLLSKDDVFETHPYTFGGLNDIYESFMLDVSGAAEIPATRVFGRAPQGMNATGESDSQIYYDSINQKQEIYLKPAIDKILPLVSLSVWGEIPSDLDYEFNPVRQPTEEELKNLAKNQTESIVSAYAQGVVSQKIALKELAKMADTTGMWSSITDEDIEAADSSSGISDDVITSLIRYNSKSDGGEEVVNISN